MVQRSRLLIMAWTDQMQTTSTAPFISETWISWILLEEHLPSSSMMKEVEARMGIVSAVSGGRTWGFNMRNTLLISPSLPGTMLEFMITAQDKINQTPFSSLKSFRQSWASMTPRISYFFFQDILIIPLMWKLLSWIVVSRRRTSTQWSKFARSSKHLRTCHQVSPPSIALKYQEDQLSWRGFAPRWLERKFKQKFLLRMLKPPK